MGVKQEGLLVRLVMELLSSADKALIMETGDGEATTLRRSNVEEEDGGGGGGGGGVLKRCDCG